MIKLTNISKQFQVPKERRTTLKESILNFYKPKKHRPLHALRNISLEIKKGESIGIIGANGSGKSTLLKILAGVYTQTTGNIETNGKISPLLELGIGFNDEMSGRDNVYLNATILGLSKPQINALYPKIIEFAGLQGFVQMKIKNYSSGMKMRLAFSIAAHVEADIYLCDEVLAVGDAAFQKKCLNVFQTLRQKEKTIILVTHDLETVKTFCDRVILLEKGEIRIDGKPEDALGIYGETTQSLP